MTSHIWWQWWCSDNVYGDKKVRQSTFVMLTNNESYVAGDMALVST
jgi:hypothetical protein